MDEIRQRLYDRVLEKIDLREEIADDLLYRTIDEVISEEGKDLGLPWRERLKYREVLFSSLRRLDILSIILDQEDVSEVMINGPSEIYVEKHGAIERYPETFITEEKLSDIVQQIASSVNRRVNEASPLVDARLSDGSRVNIVLPPVSLNGPVVTIRRFPNEPMSMEDLIALGSVTEEAAAFLKRLVASRYNIFISGGTGAGKTTFLGALSEYIPADERVITIEDAAELRLRNVKNLVRLESRPPNLEGQYAITIRDLIRNALRMRPDRIVVGEIRSEEALDMLQAMNTGNAGSMSTGHANSAKDMVSRIETMVLMGKDLPLPAIRSQIASAIEVFIHVGRLRDRSRRVLGIYEVRGIREGEVELAALYEFREETVERGRIKGRLEKVGELEKRREKLITRFGSV